MVCVHDTEHNIKLLSFCMNGDETPNLNPLQGIPAVVRFFFTGIKGLVSGMTLIIFIHSMKYSFFGWDIVICMDNGRGLWFS